MNKVKEKRQSAQISQLDLARKTGLNPQMINLIETQKFQPSPTICQKVADALNESIHDLFFSINQPK
ncbi:helix-turn-helix transcriptional regulator [Hutsoniella sourekii]|uniref:helix-turn-helix transcriptional regulator n=1 Tax=Hutsoniella sourekii TaxID=87650 RepID=UPI000480AF29|nr:helix-turn-helix domain-containing protein [Hutsoniella sourekii]